MSKHSLSGLRVAAITVASACLLAVAAGPVSADTAPGGDATFTQNGTSAQAYAGTCVANGDDTETCINQQISAFAGKLTDSGAGVIHASQVCVDLSSYTYSTVTGDFVGTPIYESGCRVDVPSGALRLDSKLASATLAAVTVSVTGYDCNEYECVPGSSRDVTAAATWTGFGPINQSKDRSTSDDEACRVSSSSKGSVRAASVTGVVDGHALDEKAFGELSAGRSSFRSRCVEG
ncbi:MAG: hypothetical protein H0V73_05130 [Chloroflexi bacterium]|nr:hypothetical protein [Chloroflexota bacterium]